MVNELLTISEVAKRLTVGDDFVRAAIADGRLPCVRFGHRTVRIDAAAVESFVAANSTATPAVEDHKPTAARRSEPATIKKKKARRHV